MPEEKVRRVVKPTAARRVAAMAERCRNILLAMDGNKENDV